MVLQRALHQPAQMLEMFEVEPLCETQSTTAINGNTEERPTYIDTDVEWGPTTTTFAPQVLPTPIIPTGMVYVLVASI